MIAALLFAQFLILGANVVAPWRLARAPGEMRRAFQLAIVPALLLSAILALLHLHLRPDAALAWGLTWPPRGLPIRLLLVLLAAGALSALLLALGGRHLEPLGWRFAAGLALLAAAGAAFAGELLRVGGGPSGGALALAIAALARLATTLAAGECATGRPRWLTFLAGVALPVALVASPVALREALDRDLWTVVASAARLLLARFLPPSLARLAGIVGVALAALYFSRAADLSEMLERPTPIPDIVLPDP